MTSSGERKPAETDCRALCRRGRRDRPPHRREGRLLPRSSIAATARWRLPWPSGRTCRSTRSAPPPTKWPPCESGLARRDCTACASPCITGDAGQAPLRQVLCRPGGFVAVAARLGRWTISADDPPLRLRPGGGIACTGKPGAMQTLHAAGAGEHRKLDAPVLGPRQHELLDRRAGARAAAGALVPRCRSGNAAAARPRPRAAVLRGADVRRRDSMRCGPSMPTTAATCGSLPLPGIQTALQRRSSLGHGRDRQQLLRRRRAASMSTTSSTATGSMPRPATSSASSPRRQPRTASRASGATSPATASCCLARWPIPSTRCAMPMCGPT